MSDDSETLEHSLSNLAKSIAKTAENSNELGDKLEAMKVLTAYYTATKKFPGKPDIKKDENELSFEDFAEDLGQLNGKIPS
jgi:hypothetical protein